MIPIEDLEKALLKYPLFTFDEKRRADNIAGSLGDRTDSKLTFIFSNPRSGSTLLMRLLGMACMTRCVGDRSLEYLTAACDMWENRKSKHTQYRPSLGNGDFPDEFSGYNDEESLEREFVYIMKMIFFGNQFGYGYMKSTVPGFNNDLIPRMGNIIDWLEENGHEVTRVILQRPAEEIAESFITSPGGPLFGKEERRQDIIDAVNNQNKELVKVTDFSTECITYEELCEDPVECLIKCNPVYTPSLKAVDLVMAKKLR